MANRKEFHERLFFLFSILVIVTLPFSIKISNIAIVLLALNWVAEGDWKRKFELLRGNTLALLIIGLYLYHAVGVIYSSNTQQGFFELEKKLSFVVFPLVFGSMDFLKESWRKSILNFFWISCLCAAGFCLMNGLQQWATGDSSYLFYHKLGSPLNFHAVYFSLYVGLSIAILLHAIYYGWKQWSIVTRALYVALEIFFFLFLTLLSSKTIIVSVFLILAFTISQFIIKRKGIVWGGSILALFLIVIILIVSLVPTVRDRFTDIFVDPYKQENVLFLDDYTGYHFTGGAIRLTIWKTIVEAVVEEKAYLFGVGTGDPQDVLTPRYIEKHVYPGDEALGVSGFIDYNAHNQFFQFLISLGLLGTLWFIVILVHLVRKSVKRGDFILFFFVTLFAAFCLTESTLQVQKGIVFFSFFSSLLIVPLFNSNKNSHNTN